MFFIKPIVRRGYGGAITNISKKVLDKQILIENAIKKVKRGKFARIIKMARKPDMVEYKKTLLISLSMMTIIGGMGFLIYLIMTYLPGMIAQLFGW